MATQRQYHHSYPYLDCTLAAGRKKWKVWKQGRMITWSNRFHYEELLARLNALIRRSAGQAQPVLTHDNIELNTVTQEVLVSGVKLELTAYEYKVLEYLMFRKGELITKTVLTSHIYDEEFDRDSNVIEVFIGRLRKKLDPDGSRQPIETLRGRGYRIPL